jgi:hypothetical protein
MNKPDFELTMPDEYPELLEKIQEPPENMEEA